MFTKHNTRQAHEMIHWLWLWVLAAITVSVLQGTLRGQVAQPSKQNSRSVPIDSVMDTKPIPIPNVDDPSLFRFPNEALNPNEVAVDDVLRLNRAGDYQRAIKAWRNLRMKDDSVTWKQVGIGAAYLRLGELDQAQKHLTNAVALDPNNAVAEYFLGRVCQQQSREVPFWFEMHDDVPFRLAAYNQDQPQDTEFGDQTPSPGKSVFPPFGNPTFDKQAENHFRRAIELAPKCNLDQAINVIQPVLQFANHWPLQSPTVRDLLISLGEADYEQKARQEIGEVLAIDN